jgi:hypothetical protein
LSSLKADSYLYYHSVLYAICGFPFVMIKVPTYY